MCFSATASFGASLCLAGTGVAAVRSGRTGAQKFFGTMPLLFAAQQASEGLLWLALSHDVWAHWEPLAKNAYLVFAEIVWPLFIPLVLLLMEPERRRSTALGALFGLSAFMSLLMVWIMATQPVIASICGHHIHYDIRFHLTDMWQYGLIYFAVTMASTLVSSHKPFRVLGVVLMGSYIASRLWYNHYTISVWCFFAAILSGVVIYIIRRLNADAPAETGVPAMAVNPGTNARDERRYA